jgi:hypothetical protein
LRRQRATCGRSWLTALRWPGDLWSKSADGAAVAGRLVVEVGWRRCDGWATVVEVGWRRCDGRATCRSRLTALRWPGDLGSKSADGVALETAGSVVLHWGSLDGACCSVEPDKAGGLIWPVPSKVVADLPCRWWLRLAERAPRTRELHCWRCMC